MSRKQSSGAPSTPKNQISRLPATPPPAPKQSTSIYTLSGERQRQKRGEGVAKRLTFDDDDDLPFNRRSRDVTPSSRDSSSKRLLGSPIRLKSEITDDTASSEGTATASSSESTPKRKRAESSPANALGISTGKQKDSSNEKTLEPSQQNQPTSRDRTSSSLSSSRLSATSAIHHSIISFSRYPSILFLGSATGMCSTYI